MTYSWAFLGWGRSSLSPISSHDQVPSGARGATNRQTADKLGASPIQGLTMDRIIRIEDLTNWSPRSALVAALLAAVLPVLRSTNPW